MANEALFGLRDQLHCGLPRPRVLLVAQQLTAESDTQQRLLLAGADVRCAVSAADAVLAALTWQPQVVLLVDRRSSAFHSAVLADLRAQPGLHGLRIGLLLRDRGVDVEALLNQGVDWVLTEALDPTLICAWAAGQLTPAEHPLSQHERMTRLRLALGGQLRALQLQCDPILRLADRQRIGTCCQPRVNCTAAMRWVELDVMTESLGCTDLLFRHLVEQLQHHAEPAEGLQLVEVPVERLEVLLDALRAANATALARRLWINLGDEIDDAALSLAKRLLGLGREQGLRFAVAGLGAGSGQLAAVAELRPELVLFNAGLLRGLALDLRRRRTVQVLAGLIQELGAIGMAEHGVCPVDLDGFAQLGGQWVVQRPNGMTDAAGA